MQPHPPLAPAPVNIRRKIFEFLLKHRDSQDQLPSQATIRELFGGFTEDVDLHLEQLAREGLLILDKDGGNGITLVPTYIPAPRIKVLGQMAHHLAAVCGDPYGGSIALDLRGIGVPMDRGMFAVQVLDDRMSDAGIDYGDIALLVHSTPMRGDIVAVEEGSVLVLRRYIIVSGIPHFLAENSSKPDLRLGWETKMQGVLWGLVRAKPCCRSAMAQPKRSVPSHDGPRTGRHPTALSAKGPSNARPTRKKPGRSRTFHSPEKVFSPTTITVNTRPWPESPSGVQLNDPSVSSLLTEDAVQYEPWGEGQIQP